MTEKAKQYQAQLAVKENLIKMLHDLISEREEKIETLENHIQGTVPTHPKPAKPSSIAKVVEAVQVAHKEIESTICGSMQITREWRLRRNSRIWKKIKRSKSFYYRIAECK